jgi:hypothetical protein
MSATIPASEIKYKKKVGTDGGDSVFEIATVGGLHLVMAARSKGAETLGVGSHRAVARFLAQKKAKNLQWTELSKSEHVEDRFIAHLLPKYEAITNRQRALEGYSE